MLCMVMRCWQAGPQAGPYLHDTGTGEHGHTACDAAGVGMLKSMRGGATSVASSTQTPAMGLVLLATLC